MKKFIFQVDLLLNEMTSAQVTEIQNEVIFTFQTENVIWSKYGKAVSLNFEKYRTFIIRSQFLKSIF